MYILEHNEQVIEGWLKTKVEMALAQTFHVSLIWQLEMYIYVVERPGSNSYLEVSYVPFKSEYPGIDIKGRIIAALHKELSLLGIGTLGDMIGLVIRGNSHVFGFELDGAYTSEDLNGLMLLLDKVCQ